MDDQKIKGVSVKHLEWLIDIIRTKYAIVKKGTRYLETIEREFDLNALANIRDFVSHIETAFSENVSEKEREESIIQSEEHLRRALVESHQLALESRLESFLDEYGQYEIECIPNEAKYGIDKITDHADMRANIRKIQEYLNDGRTRKGSNIWNIEWQMGVESFVKGYELAVKLQGELKGYKEKYYINKYAHDKHIKGVKLAVLLFICTLFAGIIISAIFSSEFIKLIASVLKVKPAWPL